MAGRAISFLIIPKRILRSPRVIVAEVATFAIAGMIGAAIPQAGIASTSQLSRLRDSGPIVTALVDTFALDHVFRSYWFLALTVLAAASLSIVVIEQIRRLRKQWTQTLTDAHFRAAPCRSFFERPTRSTAAPGGQTPRLEVRTKHRIGLAGSPIFHFGLLLVAIAGVLRALFATEAAVDLIEGETLPPTAKDWTTQWPGICAAPLDLDLPVTLEAVRATRYESGELRELSVRLLLYRANGVEEADIAVNRGLQVSGGRIFLGSDFGPAALIEWQKSGIPSFREAVLMKDRGDGTYSASSSESSGLRAYIRARTDSSGTRPSRIELRVMNENTLLHAGQARVGETVSLPSGEQLVVCGLPYWARLRGSRDPSLGVALTGLAFILVGATIMFTVVKVDTCVSVTPVGDRERVFVALRSQRYAPLYRERYQQLVREQGGAT